MRSLHGSETPEVALLQDLKSLDRWVCWEGRTINGKTRKRPVTIDDSGATSRIDFEQDDYWHTYDQALERYKSTDSVDGVGIYISRSRDDFVVVDLDNCLDPDTGRVDEEVWKLVRQANTYTEISQSGTGLHLVFRGNVGNQGWLPEQHPTSGEAYYGYFIVITQDHVAGTPYNACTNAAFLSRVEDWDLIWEEDLLD